MAAPATVMMLTRSVQMEVLLLVRRQSDVDHLAGSTSGRWSACVEVTCMPVQWLLPHFKWLALQVGLQLLAYLKQQAYHAPVAKLLLP